MFLGRFSPEKNCDLLIEAFEQTDNTMKLVLAGGSSHTDDYVANLRKHAGERIVFLEWLSGETLEEVLTNAALFVLPSDLEGLSLALLDAMGAGVCVLTSNVPENCEAIADAGLTFRRGDRKHLQQMLAILLSDDRLRREAGQKARARVEQQYLWDDVTQQLEQIYGELAGRTRALPPVAIDDQKILPKKPLIFPKKPLFLGSGAGGRTTTAGRGS